MMLWQVILVGWVGMAVAMLLFYFVQRHTKNAGIVDFVLAAGVGVLAVFYATAASGAIERRILLASLEDTQVTEQELATKVETLVEAHKALEKRVAQHIVLLRPRLTQEQRDQLGGLCSRKDVAASIAGPVSPNLLGGIVPGLLSSQVLAGSL